jgi:hypothetical protein
MIAGTMARGSALPLQNRALPRAIGPYRRGRMTSHAQAGSRPTGAVRAAIFAGVLAVSACFAAALTFSGQPAQAAETAEQIR